MSEDDIRSCPTCGALPCDWAYNPFEQQPPASVIEAAAGGETEGLDPKGKSAVAESETPNPRSGNGEAQG